MSEQDIENLYPLLTQSEYLQLETEVKEAFIEVYNSTLGDKIRNLLKYGNPYLITDDDLIKKFILNEGLGLPRADTDVAYLQFLLKAWKIKNNKRGLFFLKTYLQLLYPNMWEVIQQWQETSKVYPTALVSEEEANKKGTPHWLTSRLRINITDWSETGSDLATYRPIFQNIVGARFLIEVFAVKEFGAKDPATISMGAAAVICQLVELDCEFVAK